MHGLSGRPGLPVLYGLRGFLGTDAATIEISTVARHDALPIFSKPSPWLPTSLIRGTDGLVLRSIKVVRPAGTFAPSLAASRIHACLACLAGLACLCCMVCLVDSSPPKRPFGVQGWLVLVWFLQFLSLHLGCQLL